MDIYPIRLCVRKEKRAYIIRKKNSRETAMYKYVERSYVADSNCEKNHEACGCHSGEIWEILLREEKRAVGSELFGSFIAKAIAIFFFEADR